MQKNRLKFIKAILVSIENNGIASEHQYIPLGWIGFVSFVVYLFIWNVVTPNGYDNLLLRFIGGLLCLLLILKNKWPVYLNKFKPYFWYLTLLYCFPFFFTFMMLKNPDSYVWVMTVMTGIFFLMLLTQWIYFVVIQLLGFFIAFFLCKLFYNNIELPSIFIETLPTYFTIIIAGMIFIQRDHQIVQEKINLLKHLGSSVAHELRTPLTSIDGSAKALENLLPTFWESYKLAEEADLPVKFISPVQFEAIQDSVKDMQNEADSAFLVIDMLLKAVNLSDFDHKKFKICSIRECINTALARYTYPIGQRETIQWKDEDDFLFLGDPILTQHILFNLLKNAFYYLGDTEKNNIIIWLEKAKHYNILHFKDTGKGISPDILPRIFESFFSKTPHGTGIGLAFCKNIMEAYDGHICCQSKLGKYTEFILQFPKIK